jgi:hypothetical protein
VVVHRSPFAVGLRRGGDEPDGSPTKECDVTVLTVSYEVRAEGVPEVEAGIERSMAALSGPAVPQPVRVVGAHGWGA